MSANSLGNIFKVTSFGESHGSHVGCIVEGCPAGLRIDLKKIQTQVNRRKATSNNFSTQRIEEDEVEFISGLFEEKTTGAPITIIIKNKNQNSADYEKLKDNFRPNHADYTSYKKYEHTDHRGGGRNSIRITAPMVAAGALAEQLIQYYYNVEIVAFVSSIYNIQSSINEKEISRVEVDSNELRWLDKASLDNVRNLITNTQEQGDTLGGRISCIIRNMPIGLGEPVFNKLQAALAQAMLSINTVKGFEYGKGFASSLEKGSEHNDIFTTENETVKTLTNNSGGIQGGISNGENIYFTIALKPISSIKKIQRSINKKGNNIELKIEGRHDVCAVPRAVPIVEAYTSIVLADMILKNKLSKV